MNIFSSHSGRAQEGTLTLGSSHSLSHGKLQVDSIGHLIGKLSLFRIWGRERTAQEVTSLGCTEGDLVRGERGPGILLSALIVLRARCSVVS